MSGRTRFEQAREVPLTPSEITYLRRVLERDLKALRGSEQPWNGPPVQVFVERIASKLNRAQRRGP